MTWSGQNLTPAIGGAAGGTGAGNQGNFTFF